MDLVRGMKVNGSKLGGKPLSKQLKVKIMFRTCASHNIPLDFEEKIDFNCDVNCLPIWNLILLKHCISQYDRAIKSMDHLDILSQLSKPVTLNYQTPLN